MSLPTRPRPLPLPSFAPKSLLVVDDDRATLNLCRSGLKGLVGFKFLMAHNGREALDVLQQEPIHVLVTDLNMPVMDGFNLIAKVVCMYPQIPILVLTGLSESQHLNTPLQMGAISILSKPPRLTILMDAIRAAAQFEPTGMVRGIGLNSLLQLLNWEKKSCTLTVKSEAGMGLLYLKQGEVVHAAYRSEEGLPAAYEILTWDRPDIEFVETCRVEPTIELPLTELLMNAAMVFDHRNPEFGEA
jgi:CheY-like chemotaxis protein